MSVLDNPVWWALAGPQRHLGTSTDRVVRFHPEISPFAAVPAAATDDDWLDLARMAGSGGQLALVEEGKAHSVPGPVGPWSGNWPASRWCGKNPPGPGVSSPVLARTVSGPRHCSSNRWGRTMWVRCWPWWR